MKYTIEVFGKGAECIIHKIDSTKREKLEEGEVESDAMDYDQICEALEIDDLFDNDPEFVTGVYDDPENYEVIVRNESGHQVWSSSSPGFEGFEDCEWEGLFTEDVFIAEDYQKGQFFEFNLETEKFEVEKLVPVVTSVGDDRVEVISGFMYDGERLEAFNADTNSKGFTWHLV